MCGSGSKEQKLLITIKEEIKRGSRDEGIGAIPTAPPAYAPSIIAGLDPPPISKPENSLSITHESQFVPLAKSYATSPKSWINSSGVLCHFSGI